MRPDGGAERREHRLRDSDLADYVDLELAPEVIDGQRLDYAANRDAGIVDEHIEAVTCRHPPPRAQIRRLRVQVHDSQASRRLGEQDVVQPPRSARRRSHRIPDGPTATRDARPIPRDAPVISTDVTELTFAHDA